MEDSEQEVGGAATTVPGRFFTHLVFSPLERGHD